MKKMQKIILVGLVLAMFFVVPINEATAAAEYYVGVTWVIEGSSELCLMIRFQASGFSLYEADALYALLDSYLVQSGQADWSSTMLPSQALAQGITGEALAQSFLQKGTGVCTINNQPVDQAGLVSLYKCFYQEADHTCIRMYVHTGALNLSAYGIPYNIVAGLGAIVVAEPIWDAATAQILASPPVLPTSLTTALKQIKDEMKTIKQNKAQNSAAPKGK